MELATATSRGEATRDALIQAAIEVFARDGFDAVSTRVIAETANVNQALIGYHFKSKEGLYLAVFDHISLQFQLRVGPLATQLRDLLESRPITTSPAERQKVWLPPIQQIVDQMLSLILSPQTAHWSQLLLREQTRPTAAFERLYQGFMGRLLNLLTDLTMQLRGEADATGARLLVIGLIGQIIVWRAARAGATRLLGWSDFGPEELLRIRDAVQRNITAQLLAEGSAQ